MKIFSNLKKWKNVKISTGFSNLQDFYRERESFYFLEIRDRKMKILFYSQTHTVYFLFIYYAFDLILLDHFAEQIYIENKVFFFSFNLYYSYHVIKLFTRS